MRDAFYSELSTLFEHDRRLVFLTGDLGYKLFDALKAHGPDRVINFGIREAAMVGFAAGMTRSGLIPVVYSIVPFVTIRCLEQVKLDLCYNRSRVVLVGVGGGFAYGPNGPTHHGIDDIGVLSCLPGMRVWAPADPLEVRACVRSIPGLDGPAYLRLGRNGEPNIHSELPDIQQPMLMRNGGDGLIIAYGVILHETLKACETMAELNIHPSVLHLPTLRPFPKTAVMEALASRRTVMTVEEHIAIGGLGQEVSACIAENGSSNRLRMLHTPMAFPGQCMGRDGLLAWAGIDTASIAAKYAAFWIENT